MKFLAAGFFALVLLSPLRAWAAFVHVQSASTAGTSSQPNRGLVFGSNVLSGSLIVVGGAFFDTAAPTSTVVTDTLSTSYNCAQHTVFDTEKAVFICYGITTGGGANTVTVDPEGDAYISFGMAEFTGPDTTPLDVNGGASGPTNDDAPTDGITTIANDALVVGIMSFDAVGGNPSITPGGAYIEIGESENEATTQPFSFVYEIKGAAGAYTVDWVLGANRDWVVRSASFEPASAPPASTKKRVIMIQ